MDISKLEAEFAALSAELKAGIEKAIEDGREFSAEENESNGKKQARLDTINSQLEAYQKVASVKFANGLSLSTETVKEKIDGKAPAKSYDYAEFASDASEWIVTGVADAQFATITTATGSGLIVPKSVDLPVQTSLGNAYRNGIVAAGGSVLSTSNANQIVIPILDMGAGEKLSTEDGNTAGTQNEPDIAANNLTLGADVYGSKPVWMSNNQMSALGYDLWSYLATEMVDAKEQALESAITAYVKALSGVNTTLTASTSAISFGNWANARRKGPKRYDIQKFVVGHSDLFAATEGLVDGNGRPIVVQDPQNENLVKVLGIPFYRCDSFDAFSGTNKVLGAVISCRGFRLRDVEPARIARYVNQPAYRDKTGLELFQSHGFASTAASITLIKTPAS